MKQMAFVFFILCSHIANAGNKCVVLLNRPSIEKPQKQSNITDIFVSQENPLYYKYNLLRKDEPSSLCGITSLANFINLFLLNQKQTPMSAPDLIDKVSTLAINYYDKQIEKGNRHFSIKGMYPYDLSIMARSIFKNLNLKISVSIRTELMDGKEVRSGDLNSQLGAIWSLSFVPKNPEQDGADHFVLVLKYDKKTHEIEFVDPLDPKIIKYGKISIRNSIDGISEFQIDLIKGTEMNDLVGKAEGSFLLKGVLNFSDLKK